MTVKWYQTTKEQISAWKREGRRYEDAVARQDERGIGSPAPSLRAFYAAGLVVVIAIGAFAFIYGMISPKPNNDVSAIMVTRGGGTYVRFNGRIHEVTNLASARLIVGEPADAQIVSEDVLNKLPRGKKMGIPDAPQSMRARTDKEITWGVCDWRDKSVPLSLLRGGDITTSVVAGNDSFSGGYELGNNRAMLVKSSTDSDRLWLLYRNTRAEVGSKDNAALAALGITPAKTQSAITVSQALLDAIPPSPALTVPVISQRGIGSQRVPKASIGDVLTLVDAKGQRIFYLAGQQGVQLIGPVVAQMLINSGSTQTFVDDVSILADVPQVTLIDEGRYPVNVPELIDDPAVCWTWSHTTGQLQASSRIITGVTMPLTDEAKKIYVSNLLPAPATTVQADNAVTRPGYGYYARVTDNVNKSARNEQLLYITDSGVRYAIDAEIKTNTAQLDISYDPTVKALGLSSIAPLLIPWQVAKLYQQGETLSISSARVEQGTIEPGLQVPNPKKTSTAEPQAEEK